MLARIKFLRRQGELLPFEEAYAISPDRGVLSTSVDKGGGRYLAWSHVRSTPGMGELARLYKPELLEVGHDYLRVRGVERVKGERGWRAVVQEWRITLG
jgi:hypothetical protein